VSDRYSEVAQQLRADVAAAVRRAQRRHLMRLAARYTAVVLLTAGLVAAGVLARWYIQSLTGPWRPLLILLLWLTIAIGIVLLASLGRSAVSRSGLEQERARQNIWLATFRVVMKPMPRWVAALAFAAVLIAISGLPYDYWSAAAERRTASDPLFRVLLGMAALLTGALARAAFRRWSPSRDEAGDDLAGPPEDIQTRVHARPIEVATERIRDGTRTFIVRLEPHHDPGTQTLQEVAG
jgi:MFS family permease